MRAVVIHAAGDLRVETWPTEAPQPGAVRVRVEAGGICGSDLHYFQHGGFGAVRLREPMVLGHEVAGQVLAAPDGCGVQPGDRVAVSPSRPCGDCNYCRQGLQNHCENMRFYGSAMPMPHIQGAFRDELNVLPEQCFRINPAVSASIAAFAEPLSVVLHALRRAGPVAGRRVLITGCGPIGALALLAARAGGAAEVVVTDVVPEVLHLAGDLGASRAIDAGANPDWASAFAGNKGHFDVMIEASGNQAALRAGMTALRPRAVLVQLGLGGEVTVALNAIVTREIDIRGAFRFHEEFGDAVEMLNSARLDVEPLLSGRFPVEEAAAAFQRAGDRSQAMKIQLDFTA